jgi:hypothetical protein
MNASGSGPPQIPADVMEPTVMDNSLLPRSASNKSFATCLVVDFARARKRMRPSAPAREPRGPEARLARALEWQRELDAGEVASRAEIARREGISRARVTQIMRARASRKRIPAG